MTQYVQYNTDGYITATIITEGTAPNFARQLVFEEAVETEGKMVDLDTLTLVDIPEE